ncbi:MAG TPA: hypothetical protein PKW79_03115, partial [Rhabdochlamydiaceae bacterium]|nr:hypothetical protein [Rhabdochlamydiaceae bacterium]
MKRVFLLFWFLICQFCCLADGAGVNVYTRGEVTYVYDPIHRLTAIHTSDGKTIQYAYDYNSNLTEVSDSHGTTSYSYDALNRLIKAQFPGKISVAYEYDPANRLTKMTYPGQEEVKYAYDNRGRLIQVADIAGTTRYEYDDATNLVVKEHLANGIVTEYSYDDFARVAGVAHTKSDGTLIAEYRFSYNNNSHCVSAQEITSSGTKSIDYSYDKLNRLIEASDSDGCFEKYVYDGAGNCLAKTTQNGSVTYEYDGHNRLLRAGDTHFFYDASGNLVKKVCQGKEELFDYDGVGRLVFYKNGKDQVTFVYDGEGRRVSKTVNGKKISFINDPVAPLSRVLLEQDENGKT